MSVVEVDGLTVRSGARELVSGVSFALEPGAVTALVGESGSGKTTTGRTLLGTSPPGTVVEGAVRIGEHLVSGGGRPSSGTVGYVPQHPSAVLNPVRRVGSVLREIARAHVHAESRARRKRLVDERVRDAVCRVQLPEGSDLLRRYPHQLSGGQQQRVVLAHTLLGDPRVVVADEPTTGQDVLTRAQLVEEFRALSKQGIAVLLLTHDLDLVRALAHQIVVLHRGVAVESGPTSDVLIAPRQDHTRKLLDAQPELAAPEPAHERNGSRELVSVRELTVRQPDTRGQMNLLSRVSLDVHRAETLAVVGRSGSGKTTLARCLAGLHPFRTGEIRLDTELLPPRLRQRSRAQRARVQYVFQDAHASFNEFVPVLRQVARTAERLRGMDRTTARERARTELARLGVPEAVAVRRPRSLSGGELRRAALARAVLSSPDVVICDEITSGLDTVTQAGLLDVLRQLRRDTGVAVVVITHDLAAAASVADRMLIMHEGAVVEQAATARMLDAPRHEITRALLAAAETAGVTTSGR